MVFTPWRRIFTVTKVAAEALGAADKVGSVEVGKQADLLVLPVTRMMILRSCGKFG
ncbi:MAG: amidohydrolase family protein [Butyricimonas faecihominis]